VAGINYLDDRRMMERCEDFAFFEESGAPVGAISAGAEEFHGDLLVDFTVASFAKPYGSHAARPNPADQPEGATVLGMVPITVRQQVGSGGRHGLGEGEGIERIDPEQRF
jgi:hypothetical protein